MILNVYFDNAATTLPSEAAINEMRCVMTEIYGNPSSGHRAGIEAGRLVENAGKTVAEILNAVPGTVYFTSGGTESNNLAVFGAVKRGGAKVITSSAEHPSVLECFRQLERGGTEVTYLKPSADGWINPDELAAAVDEKTVLISLMHINNETGVIADVAELGLAIKKKNKRALFHVDAVQSFCKHKIDVNNWNIDLLSISAHKIHGPKGVGALYAKNGALLRPLFFGGSQQNRLRPGTENTAGIAAFVKAAAEEAANMKDNLNRVLDVKKCLLGILDQIGGAVVIGAETSPYIMSMSFPGIPSEVLQNALNDAGFYVSKGAACHKGEKNIDNVPMAYGLGREIAGSAIRISLERQNTVDEAEAFICALMEIISKLRKRA